LATITVGSKMTCSPLTIEASEPLIAAHTLMRAQRIRHLPVTEGGRLRGVVSLRDLHLIETLPGVKQGEVRVSEAMSTDPYAVPREAPLAMVAATMAARKLGCAIVMDGDAIAGVFTTTDGMKLLSLLLSEPAPAKARR
jgi:acetoin utilization protein AcuB